MKGENNPVYLRSCYRVLPVIPFLLRIATVLMAEGMEENVAKQQAEKAVILVQGSLILAQGLNDVQVFKRIIGDLPTELLLG
jgi:hypothetical protein